MRMYSTIEIVKKIQEKELSLFTLTDLSRLFAIDSRNSLYKMIQRLEQKGVIKKIIKGKYIFCFARPNEFAIANFLYRPSYISLESALSFYGIISGFPYQVTSMTTRKTRSFVFEEKEYRYAQVKQSLFWGFEKKENFLLADKEKSLLDFLYLAFKGLRDLDLKELDLSEINWRKLENYFKLAKDPSFLKFTTKFKK